MSILIALSIIFFIFIFIHAIRFLLPEKLGRLLFIANYLLFTLSLSYWLGFESLIWTSFLISFALISSFVWKGALLSLIILFAIFTIGDFHLTYNPFFLYGTHILYTLILVTLFHYMNHQTKSRRNMRSFFYRQSKNLHVLREVSLALQSTLQQHKLMHIFLTAVTAGYGLGFNRAMIFIRSESDPDRFSGRAAIGPLSIEEGHVIWENVVSQRLTLRDFIKLQKEAEENDQALNAKVRETLLQLSDKSEGLQHVVEKRDPMILNETDHYDSCSMMRMMKSQFGVTEMAAVPLLTRGKVIGIMLIDNIVDRKSFTYEDLDNIMPLATQGAMAVENAMLYEQTQDLVMTDGLTGLRNKRYLEDAIPLLFERSVKQNTSISVLMIDLDYFKSFNDTHGHLMGDEILIQVARILSDHTPIQGVCVRFGGEEFAMILPGTGDKEANILAESIRQDIANHPFEGAEQQPLGHLSTSIGICTYPGVSNSLDDLIDKADQAVYRSKDRGRNCVTIYGDDRGEEDL
ncbi:GGDEF domain-containing protein [Salisediminibacterium beveridgei]|uniref:Response regulator, PleD-like n=1 Tax=Salisediminibacterium beveridgei TaxID=632773 RepID=A0A1D7QV18_9BACI|nr:sensor domain-containing diguanylate cyclase [Salisediminibacterium beveridgei]AOM82860.1 Response regulator, PleD-like [Salisediminibacterium beveridgei]